MQKQKAAGNDSSILTGKVIDKIKDIKKIKLKDYDILCKVKEIKSTVILLTGKGNESVGNNYLEVIAKGKAVNSVDVGDYVLIVDYRAALPFGYRKELYLLVTDNTVKLVVDKDNLDLSNEQVVSSSINN